MIAIAFAALLQAGPQTPPAGPAPATVAVAPPACTAPPLVERPGMDQEQVNAVVETAQAYTDCMSDFVEAHRATAQDLLARFNAEAEATNAAVAEVNGFVERFNSWRDQITAAAAPTP